MSELDTNWIRLSRKLLVNDLWRSEPFTKGQAWVDLLLLANHSEGFFFNRGIQVDVKRGQVGTSELQLSIRWKWSRTKVKKFFELLEKEHQIVQHRNNVNTLITIVNYEMYQPEVQQKEQQKSNRNAAEKQQKCNRSATEVQQKSTNKNEKNEKKKEELKPTPSHLLPICRAWKGFKAMRQTGRKPLTEYAERLAVDKLAGIVAKGFDPVHVMETAIEKGWLSFYEPKEPPQTTAPSINPQAAQQALRDAEIAELREKGFNV